MLGINTISNTVSNTVTNTGLLATVFTMSINQFYGVKKDLFDIAGNVINHDKYPFINVLSGYLTDIVASIDMEIKNTSRNVSINWKEKKNPKLLSRFINNDENINNINRSVNKVTGKNYMEIVTEISSSLIEDGTNKFSDYSKYIFDCVIKKCMSEEAFTGDYIKFLRGFTGDIGRYINILLKAFMINIMNIMDNSDGIKNNTHFEMVRDVVQYRNIGIFIGNLACEGFLSGNEMVQTFMSNIDTMSNLFDWQPVNIDDVAVRMYLAIGILESCWNIVEKYFSVTNINAISECFNIVYVLNGVNNKIKFKILDMLDLIKKQVKTKVVAAPVLSAHEPVVLQATPVITPAVKPILVGPILVTPSLVAPILGAPILGTPAIAPLITHSNSPVVAKFKASTSSKIFNNNQIENKTNKQIEINDALDAHNAHDTNSNSFQEVQGSSRYKNKAYKQNINNKNTPNTKQHANHSNHPNHVKSTMLEVSVPVVKNEVIHSANMFDLLDEDDPQSDSKIYRPKKHSELAMAGADIYRVNRKKR